MHRTIPSALFAILLVCGRAEARTIESEPNDSAEEAQALDGDLTLIGSFEQARDFDFAAFELKGDLRLWRLQLAGESITSLTLFDSGGNLLASARPAGNLVRMSNLLLPPGTYTVQIRGRAGRYLFRAIDQGPPPEAGETLETATRDPEAGPRVNEIEPNGSTGNAIEIRLGERRTGVFDARSDKDYYRFSLTGETRVRLTFEPQEQELYANLSQYWGASPASPAIRIQRPPAATYPESVVWDGLLQTGDYYLTIRARGSTDAPYAFRLERRPYFERPADLEPNSTLGIEGAIPADGVITGSFTGDPDLYVLPVRDSEVVYEIVSAAPGDAANTVSVRLITEPDPPTPEEWRSRKTIPVRTIERTEPGKWIATVPAGTRALMTVRGKAGPYRLEISNHQPFVEPPAITGELRLEVDTVAAYARETQSVSGMLSLTNESDTDYRIELTAHAENALWFVEIDRTEFALATGESAEVPITVRIGPDAWDIANVAVSVGVRIAGSDAIIASAESFITPNPDASLVNPGPVWTAPESMLGGLNLGWSAFEATVPKGREGLIDGLAVPRSSLHLYHKHLAAQDLVVDLAGDTPVSLSGVILAHTQGAAKPNDLLREFRVEVSLDGQTFQPVLSGEMAMHVEPQHFAFAEPVQARFVRLLPLSSRDASGKNSGLSIGDFQVVGVPGEPLPGMPNIDIADPRLGGHVVRTTPYQDLTSVLLTTGKAVTVKRPKGSTVYPELIVGFREGRAAQIVGLEWIEGEKRISDTPEVRVEISLDGPLGPWTPAPEVWRMTPDQGRSEFTFSEPVWARFLRIVVPMMEGQRRSRLPDQLRVLERAPESQYRSIAGEWSNLGPEAVYEWTTAASAPEMHPDAGDTLETATPLEFGTGVTNTVQLGRDEDWFRIDVAEPGGGFSLALTGHPTIDAVIELVNADGETLTSDMKRESPDRISVATFLVPGTYYAHILEPPRSMIVAWDTSGSVGYFIDQIRHGILNFSRDLEPGRDEANFLPFADNPQLLLSEWTGHRNAAIAALYSYNRRNLSSSNAEHAMHYASEALAGRDGVHAILIVTDLQSPGATFNTRLWESFANSRAKVFALAVPTSASIKTPRRIHETFRDWTTLGGGYLDYLTSESRTSVAFRRAAAWLRRPVVYRIETAIDYAPPEPAILEVTAKPGSAIATRAVEVILDGSGSMLKRLDGERRYRIARDALLDLTSKALPEGTPFALRIFGKGGEGSCRTDLELPLAPLDRSAVQAAVKGFKPINLAKTPIGASLAAVASDLRDASVDSIIVVLTDGEETCDGDPGAEIAKLRALGFDVQVNIVGFALDDGALKSTFSHWAEIGGGRYFDAIDRKALEGALREAILTQFEVRRKGAFVVSGTVNGSSIELQPGIYELVVGSGENARVQTLTLGSGSSVTIILD